MDRILAGLRRLVSKVARAWRGSASGSDFDDEVRTHLRLLVERYTRQGMSPAEATRAAHRQFGNVTRVQEDRSLAESFARLTNVSRDVRHAVRSLIRHAGFTAAVVSMLALGIGANLIVFTVVNALWINPRPIAHPEQVVVITSGSSIFDGGDTSSWATAGFQLLSQCPAFSTVVGQVQTTAIGGAYRPQIALTDAGYPLETIGATWQYFSMLGVPVRGRDFALDDDRPGAAPVAIVSERLWKRAFGGRESILNQVVSASPLPLRIIGVAPPDFHGARLGERADIWIPIHLVPRIVGIQDSQGPPLAVMARLNPGITPWTAEQMIEQVLPYHGGPARKTVLPLAQVFGGDSQATIVMHEESVLQIVGITAALLLLGCCATIAALLLVHYERRRSEFGVRLALGASAVRLASQLALELGLLMIAGCVVALLVTMWALDALPSFQLPGGVDLARVDLTIDWRVMAAAAIGVSLTVMAAAALPLWRFTRLALVTDLVISSSTATASSNGLRRLLLGLHIAATTVVLVLAGMFARTVHYGLTEGTGFAVDHTAFIEVHLRTVNGPDRSPFTGGATAAAAVERLEERIRALPGVETITIGTAPLGTEQARWAADPRAIDVDDEPRSARFASSGVGADFFAAVGLPLLAGRALTEEDVDPQGGGSVVITSSLASQFWPNESPLGHRLAFPGHMRREKTVVGVVPNIAYGSLQTSLDGVIFDAVDVRELASGGMVVPLLIRTARPDDLRAQVPRIAADLMSDLSRIDIATGRDIVNRDLGRQRLATSFFSGFGVVGLAIGVCGVFGLVAYLFESRRRDFAVRLALGATSGDLARMVIWFGLEPVVVGIVTGLIGAAVVVQTASSLLFDISATNSEVYVATALLMVLSAAGASALGVARVRRLSSAEALRME